MSNTFSIKSFSALVTDIQNYILANSDKITDFNEGGGLTSQIEAFARQMEQLYIRAKVSYEKYFLEIPFYAFNFPKKSGVYAGGEVVFSRNNPASEVITIDIGTLVSTTTGLMFHTTEIASIAIGQVNSAPTTIVAENIGIDYNVPANSVNTISSNLPNVNSVTNSASTTGGQDEESDYDYLKRFQTYVKGLGKSNIYGIMSGALSVAGVRSASIKEHFPALSNLYNFSLYIDDGAGNASPALVAEVLKVIVGDNTEEYPGYKAVGVNCRVLAPQKVTQDVSVNIEDDGTVSQDTVEYNVKQAVTNYINGLGVGEEFVLNELISSIMNVSGVYDLTMITPTANVDAGAEQIIRVGSITVTFV